MPKKYIELDAALAALGEEPCEWVDYSEALTQEHNDWECHYNAISAIPTADVVEVVRCYECAYHDDDSPYHYCRKWGRNCPNDSDFFCKWGKRKNGEKEESE